MSTSPRNISANRQTRVLTIDWDDGHTSNYPFELLRAACPCASCRGGHEYMSATPDPDVFSRSLGDTPATRMVTVEGIGSYAISIQWEDGHQYGIYNWPYLRALCPCAECRANAAE